MKYTILVKFMLNIFDVFNFDFNVLSHLDLYISIRVSKKGERISKINGLI